MENSLSTQCSLSDLLKYCLGYIKLINPALSRYKLFTDPLDTDSFDPDAFFNLDFSRENYLPINLKELYELNPKDVTEETQEAYLRQRRLALRLEEIKDKYKVDEYTKQINLNFGYFQVEIPETESFLKDEFEENKKVKPNSVKSQIPFFLDIKDSRLVKSVGKIKEDYYPLFTIPVEILLMQNKYYLGVLDHTVIPNIGFLYYILGEERFYDFADYINSLEINEDLTLPLKKEVVENIWEELKSRLKLSNANFGEQSFDMNRFVVSLSSKSNYFLSQDLKNLVNKTDEELEETSLDSWVGEEDLGMEEEINEEMGEIFFPFDYDKYQLKVLSFIGNKAVIVQGPPGTGKSQTIANLLCHLAANNKRVLFLSQKAQALKVVKDKLKKLEIEYLYGYVPNRFSPVYSEEEEIDSASNTLAGVQQYVSFIHDGKSETDSAPKTSISASFNLFNDAIGQQRTFYYLYDLLLTLIKYNIQPISEEKFVEKFSKETYQEIKKVVQEINELTNVCGKYLGDNKDTIRFEKMFKLISPERNFSETLGKLIKRLESEGYDRKNSLVKFFANNIFLLKVRNITNQFPRELYEEFLSTLQKDIALDQRVEQINAIREYFYYKECIAKIKALSEKLELALTEVGLDSKSFTTVEKLIEEEGVDSTIEHTKKLIEVRKNIKSLQLTNLNAINKSLKKVKANRKENIKYYIKNRVKNQLAQATFSTGIRGILARIARALRKSKRAYRTFDLLKQDPNNFRTLKEVIPIWIMDLEDASRLIPLEKKMFDYIILDEASQCNLAYALPAMFRSEHVVFFGDSEQMRDDSVRFKTNRSLVELARKYNIPEHLQIKSKEDSVKSVLDIGQLRGFKETPLLYHYRSPKELIGFSNEYFYSPKKKRMEIVNSNYLPYLETEKIMVNHFITPKRNEDTSEKTNIAEAEYIVDLINKIKSDEKTKEKSIAVLTFFNEQAWLIKKLIDDENIKVSIIEGIQGDERDIIIYSFVICSPEEKSRYVPLSSEQGEINKELNAGRVNVAFSRARLQIHCVTSMHIDEWPDGIWIKRYLQYVEDNGKIDFYSQQLRKFDSHFEEEFYYFLRSNLDKSYLVQNQVESCDFKIDFVVTDSKTNRRIAIECDGPTHFEDESPDIYIASDIERQNILENAGWNFYRVAYSDWIEEQFEREKIVEDINDYFSKPREYLKSVREPKAIMSSYVEKAISGDEHMVLQKQFGKKARSTPTHQFNEIFRFSVDDTRDLVVADVVEEDYLWINEFYKTGSYIGYSNKGLGVGKKDIEVFIKNSAITIETGESLSIPWKGKGKSKVVIQRVKSPSRVEIIDVRQYVESTNFTGFTRRGFRMSSKQFKNFIDKFRKIVQFDN